MATNFKAPTINGNYIDRNPIADRLIDASQRVIGQLHPQPLTGNEEADRELLRRWRNDCKSGKIAGEPLWDCLGAAVRQAVIWGDALIIHGKPSSGYEASLVESRDWEITEDGSVIIGKSIIPKDAFTVLRFERANKYRGRSAFYGSIQWLNDIDEIIKNYRAVIKTSSKIALVRKTKATDPDTLPPIFDDVVENQETGKSERTTQAAAAAMAAAGGVIDLADGEEIATLADDRPAPSQMALIEFLLMCICHSYGLPPEVCFDLSSLRGANSRLRVAEINAYTREKRDALQIVCSQIWGRWVVTQDVYKRLPDDAKAKAISPGWRGSAPMTVDESRQGKTALDLVNGGLLTRRDYFAEQGLDYLEVADQLARERELFAQN